MALVVRRLRGIGWGVLLALGRLLKHALALVFECKDEPLFKFSFERRGDVFHGPNPNRTDLWHRPIRRKIFCVYLIERKKAEKRVTMA